MKNIIFYSLILFALKLDAQCVKGDCQNGYGERYYNNTDANSKVPEYYKGEWKNGKQNGKCKKAFIGAIIIGIILFTKGMW